jgi:hypothetical protein
MGKGISEWVVMMIGNERNGMALGLDDAATKRAAALMGFELQHAH